jgi:hypothetical protein
MDSDSEATCAIDTVISVPTLSLYNKELLLRGLPWWRGL